MSHINNILKQAWDKGSWLAHRQAARKIKTIFTSGKAEPLTNMKIALLSSFTIDPLADYAITAAAAEQICLDIYLPGYDQFNQEILNPKSGLYNFQPEITFLFIEWDSLVLADDPKMPNQTENEIIARIKSLVDHFKQHASSLFVLGNFISALSWPLHITPDNKSSLITQVNQLLFEQFADDPQIQILDLNALAAYHGYQTALSPEMLHLARHPFSESFLPILSQKIMSHIKALRGLTRKCLVLDCDNTLWGGIIGEDGLDGIQLGPDTPGREFVDFQKTILELFQQGVILAINSKNNYADVLEVLQNHPQMVLREKHFAALEINWSDKPANMRRIARDLNLGLDSFVFFDDNPAEREMMQQMLPEVFTVDAPDNPAWFARTLRETNLFVKAYLTEEDRRRGQIYADQRRRQKLQSSVNSVEEYLTSLDMIATVYLTNTDHIKRVAQLTQRTNQFNLTTRRYQEADIKTMLDTKKWRLYTLSLKDKFGDNGIVGAALVIR